MCVYVCVCVCVCVYVSKPLEQGVVEGGAEKERMDWEHVKKSPRGVVKEEEEDEGEGVESRAADHVSVSSNENCYYEHSYDNYINHNILLLD